MLSGIVVMQVFYGGKDKKRRRKKEERQKKRVCLPAFIETFSSFTGFTILE